ncbi:MAG: AbrB/MazE/SpoVT family DNA-binding domain-containing protein [Candidatus Micrarchaeota archaeon]
MDIEIVKLSSKGQFVLPLSFRKRFRIQTGEKMVLVEKNGMIVLRPVSQMKRDIEDEIYLMQRAAAAWREIEKGKTKRMPKEKFLKELDAW